VRAVDCAYLLRQPKARTATVYFMAGLCCFPSRVAETTIALGQLLFQLMPGEAGVALFMRPQF